MPKFPGRVQPVNLPSLAVRKLQIAAEKSQLIEEENHRAR